MQAQVGQVNTGRRDGARLFQLTGEFDLSNAWQLKEALLGAIRAGEAVVVDLSEVTFMDACLLRVLLGARAAASTRKVALRIVPPQDSAVWRVASLIDLPLAA